MKHCNKHMIQIDRKENPRNIVFTMKCVCCGKELIEVVAKQHERKQYGMRR